MPDSRGQDWSDINVEKFEVSRPPDPGCFRPKRGEFATYWKQGRVVRELRAHLGQCWFVLTKEKRLAGYITLLADSLAVERPLLEGEDVRYRTFPAVKIGLLAVDRRAKGLGTAMVRWAFRYTAGELCPRLGARFVKVDALYDPDSDYDTSGFYARFGFMFADGEGRRIDGQPFRTMYFDLKPILDALSGPAAG
jgi:GNAT superfamily N-acetyltransferase